MTMRSSRSTVTFSNSFALPGYLGELPAGDYEVLAEEELLQGLSFEAYRRTATYLLVQSAGGRAGRTEMLTTTESDLEQALSGEKALKGNGNHSGAALSPQEDFQ